MSKPNHPLSWQHDGMAAGPQAPASHRGARTAPTRPPGQGILLLLIKNNHITYYKRELTGRIVPSTYYYY
eukprot:7921296-Pyramimonas_sp.AAC.1